MSTGFVLLSVKEIGYYAARLLAAAHCLPGAAPEIARVVAAQDLLHGGALEELTRLVDDDRYLLDKLAIDATPPSAEGTTFRFASGRKHTPGFAVAPWMVDRLIAQAQRQGAASAVLTLEPEAHSWLDSVLVTRRAPGLALIAVSGSNAETFTLVTRGELFHGAVSVPVTSNGRRNPIEAPAIIRRPLDDLTEPAELAVNETGIHAVEETPEILQWAREHLTAQVSLSQRRSELYRSGRPMAEQPWQLLRSIVSQTFVPTSSRSRMGAD